MAPENAVETNAPASMLIRLKNQFRAKFLTSPGAKSGILTPNSAAGWELENGT